MKMHTRASDLKDGIEGLHSTWSEYCPVISAIALLLDS